LLFIVSPERPLPMFYALSKLVWFFAAPSNALILLVVAASVCALLRYRRAAYGLAAAAVVFLFIAALTPLGVALLLPLENRFAQWQVTGNEPPAGIIVLGGAVDVRISEARGKPLKLNEAGERITALVALARQFPAAKLVFTGIAEPVSEAEEVAKKIEALGVDPRRLMLETRARNTYENAQFSAALLHPTAREHWLLVTSAWHMPRSMGCFRRAGFNIEAYPVDFRTGGAADLFLLDILGIDALHTLDVAAKEWVGLLAYRLTGKTDSLFPGPAS
jgi:uncharacterized SAM-binding protein YcdF (DUF218 family)